MEKRPATVGTHEISRELGRGAMGTVFAVRPPGSEESLLALKVLDEPTLTASFMAAARAAATLSHPSLPTLEGFGRDDEDRHYTLMSLCPGLPLDAAWKELVRDERLATTAGLLQALAHVHAAGHAHGDIAPGNVFVEQRDDVRVHLLDSGSGDHPGSVSGTLPYLAPERIAGAAPSPAGDIFALAALLHELVFGRSAFADYPRRQPAAEAVPRWATTSVGDTAAWQRVLAPMLAIPPEVRPSAREALERLSAAFDRTFAVYPSRTLAQLLARPAFHDIGGHLEVLLTASRADETDRPSVAVVRGGRGVGRTRLLETLALRAELEGLRVVRGAALDGDPPFALAQRLLTGITGEPPVKAHDAEEWAARLVAALLARPALVSVDDVDAADEASLAVLRAVAADLAETQDNRTSFLVLATDGVGLLGARARVLVRDLKPWSRPSLRAVLDAALPAAQVDASVVRMVAQRSGGTPALALGLAAAYAEAGAIAEDGGRVVAHEQAPGEALPESLDGVYRRALARLDAPPRRILRLLALHPAPVPERRLAGWMRDGLLAGDAGADEIKAGTSQVSALAREGWLSLATGDTGHRLVALAAEELRPLLLEDMDESGRAAAHAELAVALDREGVETCEEASLAFHLLAASPDGRPAKLHRQGAHRAAGAAEIHLRAGAGAAAYTLLAAVREAALDDELRGRILGLRAEACARTGRYDEGLAALDTALPFVDDDARTALQLRLVDLLRQAGRFPQAREHLAKALAADGLPRSVRARLHAQQARIAVMQGDYDAAEEAAQRAVEHAPEGPEGAEIRGHAADARGLVRLYRGQLDEAEEALAAACAGFDAAGNQVLLATAVAHGALVRHRRSDYAGAAGQYREARSVAAAAGDRGLEWRFTMNVGVALQAAGRLGEALSHYRGALALAERIGDRAGEVRTGANLANVLSQLGALSEARDLAEEVLPRAESIGDRLMQGHVLALRGETALYQGQWEEARADLHAARSLFEEAGDVAQVCEMRVDTALLNLEVGRPDLAAEEARETEATALRLGLDELRARALVVRAEAARLQLTGDLAAAERWLEQAQQIAATIARPSLSWWLDYHRFLLLRDRGAAEAALDAGRTALRALRAQADALPERWRPGFLDLAPHRRAVRELGWLEDVARSTATSGESVWSEATLLRLLDINKRLAQERHSPRLLEHIMDSATAITGVERGFLLLRDGDALKVAVARNLDRETVRGSRSKLSRSIATTVIETGESTLTVDAMEDERYRSQLSIHNLKLRSVLCVPLRGLDAIEGAIYVDNRFRRGAFDESNLVALEALADQAAVALTNARMVEDLEQSRAALLASQANVEELNRRLEAELARTTSELAEREATVRRQHAALSERYGFQHIVGESSALERIFRIMERVLDNDVPVLVEGESGTGKELVARAIHFNGARREREFVAVNCASVPATLIESELFGHTRGAFTGAATDKRGLFEAAHRGTLFLDEVGDMPLEMQAKLLRALQSGEIQKVGDTRTIRVDVRVIAATNRDLKERVADGGFREDLYYRLNVVPIRVPPLRERTSDIPLLVQHFIDHDREEGISTVRRADRDVLRALERYHWPGNVRELATVLKNAALFAEDETLRLRDLESFPHILQPAPQRRRTQEDAVRPLADIERDAIVAALEHFGGNKKRTAETLGIDRRTLYNKLAAYEIVLETRTKAR